jgi:hypothetical protein
MLASLTGCDGAEPPTAADGEEGAAVEVLAAGFAEAPADVPEDEPPPHAARSSAVRATVAVAALTRAGRFTVYSELVDVGAAIARSGRNVRVTRVFA